MPYRVDPKNKKCVQVKKSGNWQRKGCTDGPIKNYLAALYANTKDIKESEEFDWAENMIKDFSSKFGYLRTVLKKDDEFMLTGDLKDADGVTMLYLDKEPFIVTSKIGEYELIVVWVRPKDQRPDGWEEVTNLLNDTIYFYVSTKEFDDELEVDFLDNKNMNESEGEDLNWVQDIISQPLNLKRKVLYFDDGLTYLQWGELKKFFKQNGVTYFTGDPIDVISNNVIKSKHIIFKIDDDNTVMWNDVDANINQGGRGFYKILKDGKSDLSFNDVKEKISDLFVKFNVAFLNGYDFINGKYSGYLYERKEEKSESEGFDWAFDMVQKIESLNLDILIFKGKELMIDVRDMTYDEKKNLLEVIKPYINEKTKKRSESDTDGDDWSFKCLFNNTRVKTLSLHCGTDETDYIPEEGNVCCLDSTYEEEELTPKELLVPVHGKFLLKVNLNENEEWWTDTVSGFGTTDSDVYYNEISDLLEGTPYEIVVEKSVSGGKLFKIKHRDRALSVDTWSEKFFKPKNIWEDIVNQISYFNSDSVMYETLNGLYILLIPFFRKHGIKPDMLDESEEFDWAKDLVSGISKDVSKYKSSTGGIKVTIDNWERFLNIPVVRGLNWDWGDQDGDGIGYIKGKPHLENDDYWVEVVWENGYGSNVYRLGPVYYDLYFDFNFSESNNKSKNLLTEGKYDRVTSSVVKDVMRYINYLMGKKKLKNTYSVTLPLNDDHYQEGNIIFNVDLDIIFQATSSGFELDANIVGFEDEGEDDYFVDNRDIGLTIYLDKTKGKTFYQELYFSLIETVRHEIEHLSQSDIISREGEGTRPTPMDYDQFENVFSHHTDPAEIEALTKGFYLRAKKEKKPLDTVILDYLNSREREKAITPKQKTEILKNLLDYAKKNLPRAIYQQK